MRNDRVSRHLRASVPAGVVGAAAVALWAWGRWGYLPPGRLAAVRGLVFIGWLCTLFALATLTAITFAARAAGPRQTVPSAFKPDGAATRASMSIFAWSLLGDICGVLIACVGVGGGWIGWLALLRLYLLIAAWIGLCMGVAALVRRFAGTGPAVAVALTLAMAGLASPVAGVPAERAAARIGPSAQAATLRTIGFASPLLAMVDALRPEMPIAWAQLPEMYRLSGLGQEVPMSLPPWWLNTTIYAAAGALLATAARFKGDRSKGAEDRE